MADEPVEFTSHVEPCYDAEHLDPAGYATRSPTLTEVIADTYQLQGANLGLITPEKFAEALLASMAKAGFDVYAKYAPLRPGSTVWAYKYDDDMDYTLAREKGITPGWLHAGGGPPWRVVISEDRAELESLQIPHTTIQVYDGYEPTILFRDAFPQRFRRGPPSEAKAS